MEALGLLLHGFEVLLTWKTLALMMVGLVLGIFVGVLPGLGGPNGVAILLPLTFTMDPDLGHRDALVHLLGRAVRRRDHLDPVQHSRRSLVGGDHLRRLSDGAAGQGGRSADRRLHLVVHRLAGRGAADHLPRAGHRLVRAALRAAGILRGLSPHLLLLRRPRARGKAQDPHLDVARPAARRRRHGHRVGAVAHDLRLGRAPARHQLPGRGHRPVRHQRDPADHGGAPRAARPRRRASACAWCGACGRNCRATG